jgi:hypothetical protein
MIVFLDFEASSLGKKSFPIEVAWVFEDGLSRSSLIRPAPGWSDWSVEAEALHGISRQTLSSEGIPVDQIADEMINSLSGHELYASAPSWDGKWLSVLLRAAGLARHALRLGKTDDAFATTARLLLGTEIPEADIVKLVDEVIGKTPVSPTHRALPDALVELDRLKAVRTAAATLAARRERRALSPPSSGAAGSD